MEIPVDRRWTIDELPAGEQILITAFIYCYRAVDLYCDGDKPVAFLKNLLKKNWSLK